MALYLSLCVASELITLTIPLLVGFVINAASQGSMNQEKAFGLCLAAVGAQGIRVFLAYVTELMNLDLQAHAGYLLNAKTVERIENLPESFFRGFDSAFYSQRINHDSNDLVIFVMSALVQTLANGLNALSVLTVLFVINWKIAAICLALGIAAACFYRLSSRVLFESGKEVQERSSFYFARLLEQVDSIPFIRRHSAHGWFSDHLNSAFKSLYEALLRNQRASSGFTARNSSVEALAYGCILMLAVGEISLGNMGVGYLATALGYYSTLSGAILFFMNWGKNYQDAKVCYARLCEIWDCEEEQHGTICVPQVHEIALENLRISLEGSDRTISYPAYRFSRKCGMYAIVGPNGCGKTTLANALSGICPGSYDGTIKYNGIDLRAIDCRALRSQSVGYAEQSPLILYGTLWENLTLLSGNPDSYCAERYIKRFGLQTLVRELPEGVHTVLDGRGRSISGGERQKIAIIRLLLKNSDVMILDEPTASLDEASRDALIEILQKKSKEHLVIVVSHDQRLTDACDEVMRLG